MELAGRMRIGNGPRDRVQYGLARRFRPPWPPRPCWGFGSFRGASLLVQRWRGASSAPGAQAPVSRSVRRTRVSASGGWTAERPTSRKGALHPGDFRRMAPTAAKAVVGVFAFSASFEETKTSPRSLHQCHSPRKQGECNTAIGQVPSRTERTARRTIPQSITPTTIPGNAITNASAVTPITASRLPVAVPSPNIRASVQKNRDAHADRVPLIREQTLHESNDDQFGQRRRSPEGLDFPEKSQEYPERTFRPEHSAGSAPAYPGGSLRWRRSG